jgi:conserved hypothetical protein TIGR01777
MTGVLEGRETWTRMTVAISGSSGFIGSALVHRLEKRGARVLRLVRRPARSTREVSWDPARGSIDAGALEGIDALINLAGESLAQRWTDDVKREIKESRVRGTLLLAKTLASMSVKPRAFLSGSAIGVYGDRAGELLDETSAPGNDFLASVCKEWEAATAPAAEAGVRVVNLRTGLVLGRDGGALPKILLPFRVGLGGKLGSGHQWMSWIALTDYTDVVAFLLTMESIGGPVNMVSVNPVTNEEFTQAVARVLGRPALFTVPAFAMKLVLGEMAQDTVLASQRVMPRRLLDAGFDFACPTLESALRLELGHPVSALA